MANVKTPWAWLSGLLARRGDDPNRLRRFVLPTPIHGIHLTQEQTLELGAVWACIHIISASIASCRIDVKEKMPDGTEELRPDDQVNWLLNMRPNPDMPAVNFKEAMFMQAIPFGNSYAEIVRDGSGRPAQLWPLEADRVVPRRDHGTWELYYEYTDPNDGLITKLTQRDMLHIRGPGLTGLMGDNLVARAAKSLAVAAAQDRYAGAFFGNGANPGGVLEYPGQLSDERHAQLSKEFAEQRTGPENAHRPLILEEGMKWNATAIEPQKTQLIESRSFSVEEIARWFNVPLHKIQHLLHATFSNIEHQSIEFVRDCLAPWCERFTQEAGYKLFQQRRAPWRYLCVDMTTLKEGDAKTKAEALAIKRQNGIISTNEWRKLDGMNPSANEGTDDLFIQSNMATLENVASPPQPAPKALPPGGAQPAPGQDQGPTDPGLAGPGDPGYSASAQALSVIVTMAFSRCSTRLRARRADLAKHCTASQVAQSMDDEKERQALLVFAELAPCAPFAVSVLGRGLTVDDVRRGIELIESGAAADAAFAGALPEACPPAA